MTRLDIGLVINIPNYESKWLEDNYQMRRTAVDYGVPLLTNMDLVKVFTEAIYQHSKNPNQFTGLEPVSLFEHYQTESDEDAWTDPTEFH